MLQLKANILSSARLARVQKRLSWIIKCLLDRNPNKSWGTTCKCLPAYLISPPDLFHMWWDLNWFNCLNTRFSVFLCGSFLSLFLLLSSSDVEMGSKWKQCKGIIIAWWDRRGSVAQRFAAWNNMQISIIRYGFYFHFIVKYWLRKQLAGLKYHFSPLSSRQWSRKQQKNDK